MDHSPYSRQHREVDDYNNMLGISLIVHIGSLLQ